MSTPVPAVGSRSALSFLTRPASVAVLLALVLGGWGFNAWQQSVNGPVREHMDAAARYVQEKRGAEAEHEWKQAVRLDPDNAGAWDLLGDYYLTIGDAAAARDALERVWKLRPDTPEIHYRLAVADARLQDMKAARQHAEAELKINPNHVGAMDTLTIALERTDLDPSADADSADDLRLKYLKRLTELEPTNELYMSRLADGLITVRRYAEARPVLERLVKQNSDFGAARAMRGVVLYHADPSPQNIERAVKDLRAALQQNPNDPVAQQYLGKAYLRQRKPREAIAALEKLKRLLTANPTYLFDLASAYQMAGNPGKALELRRQYSATEQRGVAEERFKLRLSNDAQDFDAALGLGLLLLGSEKPVSAFRYLQTAQKLRPSDPRPRAALQRLEKMYSDHIQRASKALDKRDISTASRHLSRAMLLLPQDNRTAVVLRRFQAVTGTGPSAPNSAGRSTSR